MKAKQIEELLVDDIEGGAIEVKSAEGYDFRFVLKKQLLMLSQGVMYLNERDELEIGFVIERPYKTSSEKVSFKFDGMGVVSSILSSEIFKALVRETNTPKAFCESLGKTYGGLVSCQCVGQKQKNHKLLGFDLSYPEIPRKRGCLVVIQCDSCDCWFFEPFVAETLNIRGIDALREYILTTFGSSNINLPSFKALNDEPTHDYKVYPPYSSYRQIEERRKKILQLKKD